MRSTFLVITILLLLSACESTPPSSGSGSSGPTSPAPSSIPSSSETSPSEATQPSSGESSAENPNEETDSPTESSQEGQEGSAPTGNESLEDLDTTLDDALDDFDETIRGDKPSNASNTAEEVDILDPSGNGTGENFEDIYDEESTAAEPAGDSNEDASPNSPSGSSDPSKIEGPKSKSRNENNSDSQPSQQQGEPEEALPLPPDIGDGRGDDIVARQMREAAMKEKDPELREKLWEEYRKYRDGGS